MIRNRVHVMADLKLYPNKVSKGHPIKYNKNSNG